MSAARPCPRSCGARRRARHGSSHSARQHPRGSPPPARARRRCPPRVLGSELGALGDARVGIFRLVHTIHGDAVPRSAGANRPHAGGHEGRLARLRPRLAPGRAGPRGVRTIGCRGGDGNRTRVRGFAGPCLNHSATPPGTGHVTGRRDPVSGVQRCTRSRICIASTMWRTVAREGSDPSGSMPCFARRFMMSAVAPASL